MWPRRNGAAEVIRVGRHTVERWAVGAASMSLLVRHNLPQDGSAAELVIPAAIAAVCTERAPLSVTLLLDSAWMPMCLADTGGVLWSTGQVDALLRHRLQAAHRLGEGSSATWELRIASSLADRHALGFAIPAALQRAMVDCATSLRLPLRAMLPTTAWCRERNRRGRARTGWEVWLEQDRSIVMRREGNCIVALNSSAEPLDLARANDGDFERLVRIEALRSGLPSTAEQIDVGTWVPPHQLPSDSDLTRWRSILTGTQQRTLDAPFRIRAAAT